jgi:hypothetical protein
MLYLATYLATYLPVWTQIGVRSSPLARLNPLYE